MTVSEQKIIHTDLPRGLTGGSEAKLKWELDLSLHDITTSANIK